MSLFITLEGLDASGKFTHSKLLAQRLSENGFNVTRFSMPEYDSLTGELINDHLKGIWKAEILKRPEKERRYANDPSAYLFQCCQLVNRMETLPDGLWHRRRGDVFIADRYNASAYAYGMAFGINLEWLLKTHRHLPQPDLNVFLDISVEESFRRRPERRDEYEKDSKMLERVRECYLRIFNDLGPTYVVVDASGSVEQTSSLLLERVQAVTGLGFLPKGYQEAQARAHDLAKQEALKLLSE